MLRTLALFLLIAAPAGAQESTTVKSSVSWRRPAHASGLQPGTRKVRIEVLEGGCVDYKRAVVTRSADALTITAIARVPNGPYAPPCVPPMPVVHTIRLGGRLGSRSVVDGSADKVRYPAPASCRFISPAAVHRPKLVTGRPTRALLCRKGDRRTLAKRAARQLARRFDALKPPPPGPGPCSNTGAEVMAVFTRPHAQPQRVLTEVSGCRYVSGGGQTRHATPALLRGLRSAF